MWLDTSAPGNLCDAIPYFDTLMGTSLCDTATSLDIALGSLEGLCPQACGLCETERSNTRLLLQELYRKQGEHLNSGLIDFPLLAKNITYDTLSCGTITSGSTTSQQNLLFNPSREKVYQFYSSVDQTVQFSTCDEADFDTLIRVLDVHYGEMSSNDDGDDCSGYTSYLEVTLAASELVLVLVEGYDINEDGNYNLTVLC
mmetsp:Transcript_44636/g.118466  ORF Transcript_44636/g.118466 Transcript_44636/m.118466 type:complete len:200 (-) Transcript_44636:91-690(-)